MWAHFLQCVEGLTRIAEMVMIADEGRQLTTGANINVIGITCSGARKQSKTRTEKAPNASWQAFEPPLQTQSSKLAQEAGHASLPTFLLVRRIEERLMSEGRPCSKHSQAHHVAAV